jgi:hypothetical protein
MRLLSGLLPVVQCMNVMHLSQPKHAQTQNNQTFKTSAPPEEAMRSQASSFSPVQVKKVIVYLGRDKTMQLLEELVSELQLTDPVSSGVTHMDNPPYYRITSSCKIPSVTSGEPRPLLWGKRGSALMLLSTGVLVIKSYYQ